MAQSGLASGSHCELQDTAEEAEISTVDQQFESILTGSQSAVEEKWVGGTNSLSDRKQRLDRGWGAFQLSGAVA